MLRSRVELVAAVLALLVLFGEYSNVGAQDWKPGGVAESADGIIQAFVTHVDTKKNTLSVRIPQAARLSRDGDEIITPKETKLVDLPVAKKAKITVNGKLGKLDQLNVGLPVSLELEVRSEMWIRSIEATVKDK